MGEEIKDNKIYYKVGDGEYTELGNVKEIELECNNKVEENFFVNKNQFEDSITINTSKNLAKLFRVNILKPKRFKKLLMSVGFQRNEAEHINNFFKYNHVIRYQSYIDLYAENVKMIRDYLKGV